MATRAGRYPSTTLRGLSFLRMGFGLGFVLAVILVPATSHAAARVTLHPWEKFLRRIEKQKGSLSETDKKNIERDFNQSHIESIFSSQDHQQQPILVVRALNLLAGPSPTVNAALFGNLDGELEVEEKSEPLQHDVEASAPTSRYNEKAKQTSPSVSPPPLAGTSTWPSGLSAKELLAQIVAEVDAKGLLTNHSDRQRAAWGDFLSAITASGFHLDAHTLRQAMYGLDHWGTGWGENGLTFSKTAARLSDLAYEGNATTLTKLIKDLAEMSGRAKITLPPSAKNASRPWLISDYEINAARNLDHIFKKRPSEIPPEDHTPTVPPRRLLLDTMHSVSNHHLEHDARFNGRRIQEIVEGVLLDPTIGSTQASFASEAVKRIEWDLLNINVNPVTSTPWFHLQLVSRMLEMWTNLRDGNTTATENTLNAMSAHLQRNPVTAAMRTSLIKAGLQRLDAEDSGHAWLYTMGSSLDRRTHGLWVWSSDPLSIVRVDGLPAELPAPVVDDDQVNYLFLQPGQYNDLHAQKRFRVTDGFY